MRISVSALLAAALFSSAPAYAQSPSGPPGPGPKAFDQMRRQIESLHRTERAQILAALAPAHRTLLATIAGELATSAMPDYEGAAKRLNGALSPAESQAVVRASQNARDAERSMMQRMTSQFPGPRDGPWNVRRQTPDAGHIVLRVLLGRPMGGFGGPPPRP